MDAVVEVDEGGEVEVQDLAVDGAVLVQDCEDFVADGVGDEGERVGVGVGALGPGFHEGWEGDWGAVAGAGVEL